MILLFSSITNYGFQYVPENMSTDLYILVLLHQKVWNFWIGITHMGNFVISIVAADDSISSADTGKTTCECLLCSGSALEGLVIRGVWFVLTYLLINIDSGYGLSPVRRQAITWTIDALLSIGVSRTGNLNQYTNILS